MGGVCPRSSWTCRPVWPLLLMLALIPRVLHCSESPAAAVGKVYPRGNHWAVGHLMGKKSIESVPELQETDLDRDIDGDRDRDYLTPSGTDVVSRLDRYERLRELMQQKTPRQTKPQTVDRLLGPRGSWRGEDRDKYLREMSDLLLLALKLQDNDSN